MKQKTTNNKLSNKSTESQPKAKKQTQTKPQNSKKYDLRRHDYTIEELSKMSRSRDPKVKKFATRQLLHTFKVKALTGPETKLKQENRRNKVFVSLQQNDSDLNLKKKHKLPHWIVPKGVKLMPTNGYEPRFIRLWGSQKRYIEANNCYAYAANQFRFWRPHKAQPGENRLKVHNDSKYIPLKCGDITNAVLRDAGNGAYKCNDPNKACGKGLTKIMMVIAPGPGAQDFHFYRQDKDGTWSHKQGWGYGPTKLDASGKVITDPRTCNRNYGRLNYSKVCSTMCIPKQFKYNI